jgi:hypothetical protein
MCFEAFSCTGFSDKYPLVSKISEISSLVIK